MIIVYTTLLLKKSLARDTLKTSRITVTIQRVMPTAGCGVNVDQICQNEGYGHESYSVKIMSGTITGAFTSFWNRFIAHKSELINWYKDR